MLQLHLRLLRAGELSRKEGGKIFGAGSRNTVAIFIGIKTPTHTGPCHIHYHDIGDYLTREQKLAAVAEGSLDNVDWTPVTPNTEGDWINQRDPTFPTWPAIGNKNPAAGHVLVFKTYSAGLKTGRDTWCYNYSRQSLSSNMRELIDQYDAVVEAFRVDFRGSRPDEQDITRFLQAHPEFTGKSPCH